MLRSLSPPHATPGAMRSSRSIPRKKVVLLILRRRVDIARSPAFLWQRCNYDANSGIELTGAWKVTDRTRMDEHRARNLIDSAYRAWSRGDVEGVLAQYVDDLTFWSNVSAADDQPLTIVGKPAFRLFVQSLAETMDSASVLEHFRYSDGIGHARVEYYVRHKGTKHALSGAYRQVTHYRDGRILRAEQYHDAARTAAFWRLIGNETAL
jgi:ketosteroid isomerase-like protein